MVAARVIVAGSGSRPGQRGTLCGHGVNVGQAQRMPCGCSWSPLRVVQGASQVAAVRVLKGI